jgi:hypothetical protein
VVSQPTESELTDHSTAGGGNLDGRIGVARDFSWVPS